MQDFIIAVDFDGTCVMHEFPKIGEDVPFCVETLKWLQDNGVKLIIWTMRAGLFLDEAVTWWKDRGLVPWGINGNPEQHWSNSPKAYAHMYIDDAALGCPLIHVEGKRSFVDWRAIRAHLGSEIKFFIEPIVED